MAKIISQIVIIFLVMIFPLSANQKDDQDSFAMLKQAMAEAGCNQFKFLTVLHSDVFNSVDTTAGSAVISKSGFFKLDLEYDIIIFDGTDLFSYSLANNQVTIESQTGENSDNEAHKQITFITNLDRYYHTKVVSTNIEYILSGKEGKPASLPDSVRVFLKRTSGDIERLEFYDINDDLNQFIFNEHLLKDHCNSTNFIPLFPDSVDIVRF